MRSDDPQLKNIVSSLSQPFIRSSESSGLKSLIYLKHRRRRRHHRRHHHHHRMPSARLRKVAEGAGDDG